MEEPARERSFGCRVRDAFNEGARRTSNVVGSARSFMLAVLAIVIWGVMGPPFHYSDTWQLVINTATTIITFLIVFLIQNTQNRDAKAMHLKLDELIRAMQGARNHLVELGKMSDDDLKKLEGDFTRIRKIAEAKSPAEARQDRLAAAS